jgi:hypothetical protein
MLSSTYSANINNLSFMMIENLATTSSIDLSKSDVKKLVMQPGLISSEYSNLFWNSGHGSFMFYGTSTTISVSDIKRRQYTTPDGYTVTSDSPVSSLSTSYEIAGMHNLFDGNWFTGSNTHTPNDYWLAEGGTFNNANVPALDFNFGEGIDLFQVLVYPTALKSIPRWMNGYVRTSADGTNYLNKGQFVGSGIVSGVNTIDKFATSGFGLYDTITVNEPVVKRMHFIATDAGGSTKAYCMQEIKMIPKTARIVTNPISLTKSPKKILGMFAGTGTIEMQFSFDDGNTWSSNVASQQLYSVPAGVTTTSFRMRFTLVNGAQIQRYGFAWA